MQSLWLILQLLICLFLGFILAKRMSPRLIQWVYKILPYFTYILLVAIAMEFADTINSLAQPTHIIKNAFIIASLTSLGSFLCCYIIFKILRFQPQHGKVSTELLFSSLLNISYALFALIAGYFLATYLSAADYPAHINTWYLLLFFMLLIGIDLAQSPINKAWLNWKILLVPVACIVGSILGACAALLWIEQLSLSELFLLSQGYGFYSMSSIVISELKNPQLGSIALVNDLLREVFAILLMYLLGWRYPRAAIATAGATAMDVTLPMVKQSCGNQFIPHAMVSGFILSIVAPIAVSMLAAL
ncbi:lysine exporter LysO family protein [Acinetobacter larvae]|uniref:Lysine exporter LysO family protein n=1 Tax=Acinetobacter larvae TaxID=1789224 RepID=A0A1B2LYH0_9GAMM|nr:lysine exporter LysO family protein [Acinetobacter larvae]AOA57976.1 hypothetical protein BFG52_06175 [Acinetobacter larvae]